MKTKSILITILLLAVLVPSCDCLLGPGPCDASGPVIVYKTKNDYLNNVTVRLSKDKKSIIAKPGQEDALRQKPLELANGYLLKRMLGDVYLSLTIEEYAEPGFDWDNPNLIEYVINTDPYLEKYNCCEYIGMDTVQINILIKGDNLFKCDVIK